MKPERREIEASGMERASTEKKLVYFMVMEGEKAMFLRVRRHKCEDLCYRISRSMAMRSLVSDYCDRMGLEYDQVLFVYGGAGLNRDKTAEELQMDFDDVVDVISVGSTEKKLVYFMEKEGENTLVLRLKRPGLEDVFYKVSRNIVMGSVMFDYCHLIGLVFSEAFCVYQRKRLDMNKTAEELQMKDGDAIEVYNILRGC